MVRVPCRPSRLRSRPALLSPVRDPPRLETGGAPDAQRGRICVAPRGLPLSHRRAREGRGVARGGDARPRGDDAGRAGAQGDGVREKGAREALRDGKRKTAGVVVQRPGTRAPLLQLLRPSLDGELGFERRFRRSRYACENLMAGHGAAGVRCARQ